MKTNMKKLIFCVMAATVALAACNKTTDQNLAPNHDSTVELGNQVCISFTDEPQSRAFFAVQSDAEEWEKSLSSVTIMVFKQADGTLVFRHDLTADEVTAKKCTFGLPWSLGSATLEFYAIANYDVPTSVDTETKLKALHDVDCSEYNGTIDEVWEACKRPAGFTMSAVVESPIPANGAPMNMTMALKRTVAKFAIRITVDPQFTASYPGKIKSVEATFSRVTLSSSSIIAPASGYYTPVGPYGPDLFQVSKEISDGVFANVFYLSESGQRSVSGNTMLTLSIRVYYDADGNFATTNDVSDGAYLINVNADNGGIVFRNGYYRIDASLKTLSGYGIIATITPSSWTVVGTNSVDLGSN